MARVGEAVNDLRSLVPEINGSCLAANGLSLARQAAEEGQLERLDISGMWMGAPIARPTAVTFIG